MWLNWSAITLSLSDHPQRIIVTDVFETVDGSSATDRGKEEPLTWRQKWWAIKRGNNVNKALGYKICLFLIQNSSKIHYLYTDGSHFHPLPQSTFLSLSCVFSYQSSQWDQICSSFLFLALISGSIYCTIVVENASLCTGLKKPGIQLQEKSTSGLFNLN